MVANGRCGFGINWNGLVHKKLTTRIQSSTRLEIMTTMTLLHLTMLIYCVFLESKVIVDTSSTQRPAKFDLDFNGVVNEEDIFTLVGWIELPPDDSPDSQITIEFCETGDVTGDGLININDMNHVEACYYFSIWFPHTWIFKYSQGDLNGDLEITLADFDLICANWSEGECPGPPAGIGGQ